MDTLFAFKSAKKAYTYPVTGSTKGTIPLWINGSLFRVGPGKFEVGMDKYNHAFDGLAMIQGFNIKDGQVIFISQYVQSRTYLQNMAANRIVVSEFGTAAYPDPCRTIFNKLSLLFTKDYTDNTSVCVYPIGDEIFTATETDVIHRIDPFDLSTIGSVRLSTILTIHRATAHHHIDYETGELHLLGFVSHPSPSYAFVKLPPIKKEDSSKMHGKYDMENLLKEAKIIGKIDTRWKFNPSYYHSFGITENYYILFECPLTISVKDLLKAKASGQALINAFKWWPDEKTIIYLMDRKTGKVLPNTYITEPLFTFHHINAYEDEGHVVIDYCGYDNGSVITDLILDGRDEEAHKNLLCTPRRLIVPIYAFEKVQKSSEPINLVTLQNTSCTAKVVNVQNKSVVINCTYEVLSDQCMELPTINYNAYNSKKYRYLYGVSEDKVFKVDTLRKETVTWSNGKDSIACESLFIKTPDASDSNSDDEDSGILLAPILIKDSNVDTERYQSLVFIDAKTMKELGRSEFQSVSIPFTFHGLFRESKIS